MRAFLRLSPVPPGTGRTLRAMLSSCFSLLSRRTLCSGRHGGKGRNGWVTVRSRRRNPAHGFQHRHCAPSTRGRTDRRRPIGRGSDNRARQRTPTRGPGLRCRGPRPAPRDASEPMPGALRATDNITPPPPNAQRVSKNGAHSVGRCMALREWLRPFPLGAHRWGLSVTAASRRRIRDGQQQLSPRTYYSEEPTPPPSQERLACRTPVGHDLGLSMPLGQPGTAHRPRRSNRGHSDLQNHSIVTTESITDSNNGNIFNDRNGVTFRLHLRAKQNHHWHISTNT